MMMENMGNKLKAKLRVSNPSLQKFLAEFAGTFVLITFGCASDAQSVLSRGKNGDFLSSHLSWGCAVAMALWVSGGVSGGHLNPAVSLTMAVIGRLSWFLVPIYMTAQYLGAFVGAACVYSVYIDALDDFDGGVRVVSGPNATAGIFAPYPQDYLSTLEGVWDQIFGTFMLVLCVMAIGDKNNMKTSSGVVPVAVGALVFLITSSLGLNCGSAINPARDLGPRLFTAAAGWGKGVFTYHNYWFWVPLVMPHVGAILGAWFYLLFVGIHAEGTTIAPESVDNKSELTEHVTASL